MSKNAQAGSNDKSCLYEFADCQGAAVGYVKNVIALWLQILKSWLSDYEFDGTGVGFHPGSMF